MDIHQAIELWFAMHRDGPETDERHLLSDAADEIERLRAELQRRDDLCHAIMSEDCDLDEKHCSCVPLLRMYITDLRADLRELSVGR